PRPASIFRKLSSASRCVRRRMRIPKMLASNSPSIASQSASTGPCPQGRKRAQQDLQIQQHPILEPQPVPASCLPKAGDPRPYRKAAPLPAAAQTLDIPDRQRPRTYQRHFALEHVEELGQLIETGAPEPAPYPRDTRIVANLECGAEYFIQGLKLGLPGLGINGHGPKFPHEKPPAVVAHPHLPKKGWPR